MNLFIYLIKLNNTSYILVIYYIKYYKMNINEEKKEASYKNENLNKIIELKAMNTDNEEEDTDELLLTGDIKSLDLNLTPKTNFELFKKYFPIIITFLSFFLSYYSYYLSLEPCFGGFDVCVFKKKWIKAKVIEVILPVLINTVLFELMIFKK